MLGFWGAGLERGPRRERDHEHPLVHVGETGEALVGSMSQTLVFRALKSPRTHRAHKKRRFLDSDAANSDAQAQKSPPGWRAGRALGCLGDDFGDS